MGLAPNADFEMDNAVSSSGRNVVFQKMPAPPWPRRKNLAADVPGTDLA